MNRLFCSLSLFLSATAFAILPHQKNLPISLAPHESVLPLLESTLSQSPVGPIHALGEWEEADAAMTLWTNPSWVKALSENGNVKLFADGVSEQNWWISWLGKNGISPKTISYFLIPTDSIWIRDYGPWFVIDGNGVFSMVDTTYNRPRPTDDRVPAGIAKELDIPRYSPNLVHTGGNFYNDGLGNGFSSTLVYTENKNLSKTEIDSRMNSYLGIERYTTSRLAPGITIEHLDTFGKLVSPDTWVFSDFPEGSRFRQDSENMLALLKTLRSPYGTPYKIHRIKMTPRPNSGKESYRAYINSFISNGVLYFPGYGDSHDKDTQAIYQAALPGYKIVLVDNGGTEWGDSVHCRSRNLMKRNTMFIFPQVDETSHSITAKIIPSPGATLVGTPVVNFSVNGGELNQLSMVQLDGFSFKLQLPGLHSTDKVSFYIEALDTRGVKKQAPIRAEKMRIEFVAH